MHLHRAISTDLPLIVVALEEEATHLHDLGLPILVTGAGKVNAAVAVATVLGEHSPRSIINLGTAGALMDGLTGIHVISQVRQHDLDDKAIHALTGMHFGLPIDLDGDGPVLTTGDVFVDDPLLRTRLAASADLVDMEGYAVAKAAQATDVPVMLVKMVSDTAGGQALRTWRETVDDCAEQLGAWLHTHLNR
jgi:adenosylhomocysteine nucleosidase